ncbi:hypothetical protein [Pseudoxanthomonas sangjuensis]|uniref:hypothetical protein n=1 Tax=Pseudoxanthomonas sangjuensis TaxID=1503750 RepID=UPI0013906F43|nr:hypothetical protein [Pseudoxanthomonas sangjuensis]
MRHVLAVSATVLSLSVPAVGFAGTCNYNATTNTYACNGDFAQGIPEGAFVPPADLTVVLGDETPTSVIPAAGETGVDASWVGDITIVSHMGTGIETSGADGIRVSAASGSATLANYGSIATDATAYSAGALDIYAVDDVTMVNGGDVFAGATSGYNSVVAAVVSAGSGDISVDNLADGSFSAGSFHGSATALSAEGNGIAISNDGVINADSVYGNATGIDAYGTDVSVQNSGDVSASGYMSAAGISAYGKYAAVDNSGTVSADADADNGNWNGAIGVRVAAYDAVVHNGEGGLITASNTATNDWAWARARGVYATGFFDGVTVENEGDIQAYARSDNGRANADGIYAFGYAGPTTVTNAGDIEAHAVSANGGAYATGINAIGYASGDNDSVVVNAGSIHAQADGAYAYAFGAVNLTRQRYGSGYLANDGDIRAEATGGYATATGAMNLALRYGDATAANTGAIEAIADGTYGASATGLYNYALVYDAFADNSGMIDATATGDVAIAVGIYNHAVMYGSTTTVNSGDVGVHADGDALLARAAGVVSTAEAASYLTNYGSIDVSGSSVDGDATAAGLYALSYELSTVRNYGDVSAAAASTNGDASAYGTFAFGGFSGIGLLINGGELDATASAGTGGYAYAAGGAVIADVASIFNDVSMGATASAGEGGIALATAARAYGLNTAIYSYGDLSATAMADGGTAQAIGAYNFGYTSGAFYNAGNIAVDAAADGGMAAAYGAYSVGVYYAYAGNLGTISAEATGDQTVAMGLVNLSMLDAITVNQGDISAVAVGGQADYGQAEATAFGIYNMATYYASSVDNSGTISATALAQEDLAGSYGFLQAKSVGVAAFAANSYWYTDVVNSGDIAATAMTSQGYAAAWGVAAQVGGKYAGALTIDNTGSILGYASADFGSASATGVYAYNLLGDVGVTNYGDIDAVARTERGMPERYADTYAYATAVVAVSPFGYGDASVDNHGNIRAHASAERGIVGATGIQALGKYANITNAADASIIATAETSVYGGGYAAGLVMAGIYGIDLVNDGQIIAYGHTHGLSEDTHTFISFAAATGVYAGADFGSSTSIANNGTVDVIAIAEDAQNFFSGLASATGIGVYSRGDVAIINSGNVTASADTNLGVAIAYATDVKAGQYGSLVNEADGAIVAQASSGSLHGDYNGGVAHSQGMKMRGASYATIYNAGTLVSHATVTADSAAYERPAIAGAIGASIGYYSSSGTSEIVNAGDIEAVSSADFGYAMTHGTYIRAQWNADTANTGAIRASATAVEGDAWAVGSYAYALHQTVTYDCGYKDGPYGQYYTCDWANPNRVTDGGTTTIDNDGQIRVASSAEGGVAHGYGAVAIGALEAGITNAGHISVVAEADDAVAVGALANSFYGSASLTNGGDILAVATGPTANATGANLLAETGVQADNSGTIIAAAYGDDATATAVSMQSYGSNVLTNTGTIAAIGDGARIAISSSADAAATLVNRGSLTGAVVTGGLDDTLENAAGATWRVVGESDFGDGNDYVVNSGTILMDDASILMGAEVVDAAAADFAAFAVPGIDAFANNGTIVVNGADNAIDANGGAFYNNGVISFVDGAPDDVLTITGDFSGDGAINLDVSGLNQASDQLYVDGSIIEPTTQTLNVNLLDLPTAPNIDVPLIATSGTLAGDFVLGGVRFAQDGFVTMDFGLNVSDDSVSLGVDVVGLNATGSLAAVVAPGVQSLVNAQVGTFRQRMGVVPEAGQAGVGPWMRLFTDSGDVDARYSGNFGAGGLGFHQSNHGWEAGIDTRPSEHIAFGAFIGKSDGSQRLQGAGSNRLDGSTFGLYGTWFGGHGAYVDVSHRWTGVDARLRSALGAHTTKASAQSFNVEGGFTAWTSTGGLNVVPQLQYTHTRIGDIRTLHASQAEFANDGGVSSRARLGVALDRTFQGGGFTLIPYGSFNVVREFDGDFDHAVNGGIQGTTSTDGTSAMVELGLGARKGRLSVAGGANWMDGGAVDSVTGAQLTVRYSW